jgi:protein-tyrosine phosphatase
MHSGQAQFVDHQGQSIALSTDFAYCHLGVAHLRYKNKVNSKNLSSLDMDFVPTPWHGQIALSSCPGGGDAAAAPEEILVADIAYLKQHGICTVVSLLDTAELERLGAKSLSHHLGLHGIAWHQLPVVDFGVPSLAVTAQWCRLIPALTQTLRSGPVLVHCAHGKGRSGTLVATLFKAWGWTSDEAVKHVRKHRPGAIETLKQEAFVHAFEPPL